MLNTPIASMLLILAASVLGAVGPFLFQHAAKVSKSGPLTTMLSPWALLGMVCYVTVMVLFTSAFKLGGGVKVLYPIYATTFIWAAVLALVFYNQPIRPMHGLGMVMLVAGIVLMSWQYAADTNG